jgi:hypothetical protein
MMYRRAKFMTLDKYMVVGRSVAFNHGLTDAMIAEMFEAVKEQAFQEGMCKALAY